MVGITSKNKSGSVTKTMILYFNVPGILTDIKLAIDVIYLRKHIISMSYM